MSEGGPPELVRETRTLLERVVTTVAKTRPDHARHDRLVWSDSLLGAGDQVRDELHVAVCALAHLQRVQGVPPERMLKLLKGLVHDAHADSLDWTTAQSLSDDVVQWGIEGYYAA